MPKRVYIEYIGCARRGLDATRFSDYFHANGVVTTRIPRRADYILFITCAFRDKEEDYVIDRIRALSRHRGKLIVGGCLKGINKERLERVHKGPSFTTANNERIDTLFPHFTHPFREIADPHTLHRLNKLQLLKGYLSTIRFDASYFQRMSVFIRRRVLGVTHHYHLRIAWGCVDEHCTYCKIWRAVGKLRSKPMDACVTEFERALADGHDSVTIVADNLGAYGLDLGLTLPDLLDRILTISGDYTIELGELHPFWLIRYLDTLSPLLRRGKVGLIICPIQSGSDRILKLMNRRHTSGEARTTLAAIKGLNPNIRFETHVIVGFPSETEEDFEETLTFLGEIGFDMVQVLGYSTNPMITDPDIVGREVAPEVIRRRIAKAIAYCKHHGIACATA